MGMYGDITIAQAKQAHREIQFIRRLMVEEIYARQQLDGTRDPQTRISMEARVADLVERRKNYKKYLT